MRALSKNNKGAAAILTVVLIMGAFGLAMYYQSKAYSTMIEFGARPRAMVESYTLGEQARAYMGNAVERAAEQAFYEAGYSGTYASSICNEPLEQRYCFMYRDGEQLYGFACEEEDLKDKESYCSRYDVTKDTAFPYEKQTEISLDCSYRPSFVVECAPFDDFSKTDTGVEEGIQCKKLTSSYEVIDSFYCYDGHMQGCTRNDIEAGWTGSRIIESEVFACEAVDITLDESVDAFECYKDKNDGCVRYGVSSFNYAAGEHKLSTELICEVISMDITCSESLCGEVAGYSVWNDGTQDCIPDIDHIKDVVDDFIEAQFEKMLFVFTLMSPTDNLYYAADINFTVDLNSTKPRIVAKPEVFMYKSIYFEEDGTPEISEEEVESMLAIVSELNFSYSLSPYFEAELPYNPVDLFVQVGKTAKDAVNSCGSDTTCIKEKVGEKHGFIWNATYSLEHVLFDLESKEHEVLARTPGGELIMRGLPVRFAMKA